MKILNKFLIIGALSVAFVGCEDDDDSITPAVVAPATTTYDLASMANSGVSGTAVFVDNADGSVTVNLSVSGTSAGNSHPSHIHFNTAAESGGIAVSLTPVDGATGSSSTTFRALDDGTSVSYESMIDFDGYINIHLSANDLATVVAQGDIGQNDLTGTSKTYALGEKDVAGISGNLMLSERKNGEALAVISLQGTPAGGSHPAHIHFNTALESGGIAFTFTPVDGTTGKSMTNIAMLDDNTSITYDDLLTYDGYVNVHLSSNALSTIVAQGDIGQNELTGQTKVYTLAEKDVAGIMGDITFAERANGSSLATIALTGTPPGGSHPAHIHMNDAATTGPIAFTFTPVDGDTGMSQTNVVALDDNTTITYSEILTYDGYVNVHFSSSMISTIVAQGNIGSNAP